MDSDPSYGHVHSARLEQVFNALFPPTEEPPHFGRIDAVIWGQDWRVVSQAIQHMGAGVPVLSAVVGRPEYMHVNAPGIRFTEECKHAPQALGDAFGIGTPPDDVDLFGWDIDPDAPWRESY